MRNYLIQYGFKKQLVDLSLVNLLCIREGWSSYYHLDGFCVRRMFLEDGRILHLVCGGDFSYYKFVDPVIGASLV